MSDPKLDQRVVLADFTRHLVERDGYPFAIGRPAEPEDPPLIAERVFVHDTRGEGEPRRGWVTGLDAGDGYLMIRLYDEPTTGS